MTSPTTLGKPEHFQPSLESEHTDDNIARAIAGNLVSRLMSAPRTKEVFVWDGACWRPDEVAAADALVRDQLGRMGDHFMKLANGADDPGYYRSEDPKYYRSLAKTLGSRARQEAIKALILKDPRLTYPLDVFDTDSYTLATPSSYINLRTGEATEPNQAARITRLTGTPYRPDAEAPRFERLVDEITGGDKALARYLQKLVGYSLIGNFERQEFYIAEGGGSNGKDTFFEVIEAAMGDYFGRGTENMLIQRKHDQHSAEVYALRGKRLIVHSESDQGKRLAIARIKHFTGTPTIPARPMRVDPLTFPNTWTHILMTNHLPVIEGTDYGTLRRLVVVPFPVTFYRADDTERPDGGPIREDGLARRIIETEVGGALRWAVEGAVAYSKEGLDRPAVVEEATRTYLEQTADPYGVWAWTQARTSKNPARFVDFASLHADYTAWTNGTDFRPAGDNAFGRKMTDLGYPTATERIDGTKTRVRRGIQLNPSSDITVNELFAGAVSAR